MEHENSDTINSSEDISSEKELRRQSESSSGETTATASVHDLTLDFSQSSQSIPTIDVTIDSEHDCRYDCMMTPECPEDEMADWTKNFQRLIGEAPFLESAVVSNTISYNTIHGIELQSVLEGEKAENTELELRCDWIDKDMVEEGRKFVRRNFFAVFLAHFIGIAFLLTVRPIQSLLLRTSALHRKENTLRRYVKFLVYLKRFYESPLIVSNTTPEQSHVISKECKESIYRIQALQRNAAKNFKVFVPPPWDDLKLSVEEHETYEAVREDMKQLNGICTNTKKMPKILYTVNPDVPMSQYDLVIIQYAFMGLIAQIPRAFGIFEKSNLDEDAKGLKGFIHLWAVLGHLLGIEERFNLCIKQNYDPETNFLIFKQVFLFSFRTMNETAVRMWRSMTAGSSRYFFFFRTKAMMFFMCKDVAQLENCPNLQSIMKPMERCCYYFYKFLLDWVLWVPPFRVILNLSLRIAVHTCQYFLTRAKKRENKWDSQCTIVCVIDPPPVKENDRVKK